MSGKLYANHPELARCYCEGRIAGAASATQYASVVTGTVGAKNAITWTAKRAGNGTVVRLVNPGTAGATLAVSTSGHVVTASLATSAKTGTSGVVGDNNALTWTIVDGVTDAVVVDLVDPEDTSQELTIETVSADGTTTITITLATDDQDVITTTAADLIAAIPLDEDAAEVVTVDDTGASTGEAAVTDQTVSIAAIGTISTTADALKTAVEAESTTHAMVGVADYSTSDGTGAVVAAVATLTGSACQHPVLGEDADAWSAGYTTGANSGSSMARDGCAETGKDA